MSNLIVLIKKEILEHFRTKKILILCMIFLFVAIASPIFAKLMPLIFKSIEVPGVVLTMPDPTYMDSIDQYVKNISQLAIFVIIFLVAGGISEEKNSKTIEMVLTKPISREIFILSKFLSYFLSITIVFLLSSLLFYAYTVSTFGMFSFTNFIVAALNILLYILMISSTTLFASSFVKNHVIAAIVGFIAIAITGPLFTLIKMLKDYAPNMITSSYKDIIVNGFSNDFIKPIIVTILIMIFSVGLSVLLFRRQEIER